MTENVPGQVILPCTTDQFGDFISTLLGQPQEIEGGSFGCFTVGKEEIEQTYHLITQRVQQQNGVTPINFGVRIVYDDGTSIQLNSLRDFQMFNEPKPVISTEAHLTFTYLIAFPANKVPERQDITVSFVSSSRPKSIKLSMATFAEKTSELFGRGYISYRIKYTARTWGADIEGLLNNHIEHLIQAEDKLRAFVRRNSMAIGSIVGALTFAIIFYGQSLITESTIEYQIRTISNLFGAGSSVNDKLDTIIRMIVSGTATQLSEMSTRFVTIGAFFSLILTFYVESKADNRKPSFVILTKRSLDEKELLLNKFEKKWTKFWGSVLFGVVIGIASNYVYEYYAKNVINTILTDIKKSS